jgi:beta-lactamase superfamily II metal-dependent hydrolase
MEDEVPATKGKKMSGAKSKRVSRRRPPDIAPSPPLLREGRHIRVRMYNVGFGDAFLVMIPDGSRVRRLLFDCGSIEASKTGGPMSDFVDKIIGDVTDSDGVARIDVVVATHRHKDHVSGFANAAWQAVEVKEVWMPWTEHPTDGEARRIRETQSRLALGLSLALAAPVSRPLSPAEMASRSVSEDIVRNALMLSNEPAMKTLHSGFSGLPVRRFLPLKDDPARGENSRMVESDALPGVRVHALGPSRDPKVIRDMDPPRGESYLKMREAVTAVAGTSPAPFAPEFVLTHSNGAWVFPPDDIDAIARAGTMSELAIAVALDKAVNGTSLMLLLDVAGTLLLFPGDAQWGTWLNVLQDDEWKGLLERLAFYKIGHHGSHNATPRKFVTDVLPTGCCAMASTLTRKIWPDIPKSGLLAALNDKSAAVARSDQPETAPESFQVSEGVIEARIPF